MQLEVAAGACAAKAGAARNHHGTAAHASARRVASGKGQLAGHATVAGAYVRVAAGAVGRISRGESDGTSPSSGGGSVAGRGRPAQALAAPLGHRRGN